MSVEATMAETSVTCLTPAGTGAIATLALHGPRAWQVVRELFRPHPPVSHALPSEPARGRIWLGRMGEESTDEVVVSVRNTNSVPTIEVHCHGGREVIRMLLEAFEARGVRQCTWQDFERLIHDNPLSAAAAVALAEAPTLRTATLLLDQYHGAFAGAIGAILAAWQEDNHDEAGGLIESLAGHAKLGRHLTSPWRVVIAGGPNVGKSSLVNALAGFQRCIVAPTPGTTRDVVTTVIAIDGWPLELADTAGLRQATGSIEEQGIGRARAAVTNADLCLWVLDASTSPIWPDHEIHPLRFVINKVDLPAAWDLDQAGSALRVSALKATGLAELCQAISDWLVPSPPPQGAPVPFTPPLCDRVETAWWDYASGRREEAIQALADLLRRD